MTIIRISGFGGESRALHPMLLPPLADKVQAEIGAGTPSSR